MRSVTEAHPYSLGQIAVEGNHGALNGHQPVKVANFVSGEPELLLPEPKGDAYLSGLPVSALRGGERAICLTLIPGLIQYYQRLGLVFPEQVIMVDPQIKSNSDGEVMFGHPATNPLVQLGKSTDRSRSLFNDRSILVPTFSGPAVRGQAEALGLRTLGMPDSRDTNNKALFREAAKEYGYRVLPGTSIQTSTDFKKAVSNFGNTEHGVWLKVPTGSGGDLVLHIEELSEDTLRRGIHALRESAIKAINQGEFDITPDQFWPLEKLAPEGLKLVLETDARNLGEIVVNASSHFVTHKNRGVLILGYFQQIISPKGEYLGSRPYYPQGEVKRQLDNQTVTLGRYNMKENGYYGVQGGDYFVIDTKSSSGDLVYVTEVNSRPPVSAYPSIISNKIAEITGHNPEWINTNVSFPRSLETIDDFIAIIGETLAYGDPRIDGLVIPLACRSLVTAHETVASPDVKIMIVGKNQQHCSDIREQLEGRGIQFSK